MSIIDEHRHAVDSAPTLFDARTAQHKPEHSSREAFALEAFVPGVQIAPSRDISTKASFAQIALLAVDSEKDNRAPEKSDKPAAGTAAEEHPAEDLTKAGINTLIASLGDSSQERRNLAKAELDRWHVSYAPESLILRLLKANDVERKAVLTALNGMYGIKPELAILGAQLGSDIFVTREDASERLAPGKKCNIELAIILTRSADAEVKNRAEILCQSYLLTADPEVVGQFPEIVRLIREGLFKRCQDENTPPERSRLLRDLQVLMQSPQVVQERIKPLEVIDNTELGDARYDARKELDCLRNLKTFASQIDVELVDEDQTFAEKRAHMIRIMKNNPEVVKSNYFNWKCDQVKVFEDPIFVQQYIRRGGDPKRSKVPVNP